MRSSPARTPNRALLSARWRSPSSWWAGGPIWISDRRDRRRRPAGAGGMLQTPLGVPFRTPAGISPNCLFLSQWNEDRPAVEIPLTGQAEGLYLLDDRSHFPAGQPHGARPRRGGYTATAARRNSRCATRRRGGPSSRTTCLDDYLFIDRAPLPPRVDLHAAEDAHPRRCRLQRQRPGR